MSFSKIKEAFEENKVLTFLGGTALFALTGFAIYKLTKNDESKFEIQNGETLGSNLLTFKEDLFGLQFEYPKNAKIGIETTHNRYFIKVETGFLF